MLLNTTKKKSLFLLLALLLVSVNTANVRVVSYSDPFCNQFDQNGDCCQCSFRYYFNRDTKLCTQVSDNCATWDHKTGDCLTCYPSYGSPVDGVCGSTPKVETGPKECDPNCQCYNDNRHCIKCFSGYKLDSHGSCIQVVVEEPPVDTDKCLKYAYVDEDGQHHAKWFSGCKTVCVKCVEGYELKNGFCVIIVVQEPQKPTEHCKDYGYLDHKGQWVVDWAEGCKKVCKKCLQGSYLDKKYECLPLPEKCKDVNEEGECTECVSGYELGEERECEQIVEQTPTENCAEYGYVDNKGTIYVDWIHGCRKVCLKCESGYYLDADYECQTIPDNCDEADVYGKCISCAKGYKLNHDGECNPRTQDHDDDNCAVYGYLNTEGEWFNHWIDGCKKVCKQCKKGYELQNGKCVACEPEVEEQNKNPYCVQKNEKGECCKCEFRTFLNGEGICTRVSDDCEDWDHKTGKCTCCYQGYKLVEGECILA